MSVEGYLALALAAVVLGIGGYVASLVVRKRRLEQRRAALTREGRE
jgi:CcmD family protein